MKPRFNWRHQYDVERDTKEGDNAALHCEDDSLTVQSFAQDADLNVIAKRFGINAIPTAPLDPALFRDTTNDPDLRQILDAQRNAKEQFLGLPAKLRARCHNNPKELWDFLGDPDNHEEALRLGLLKRLDAAPAAPSPSDATTTQAAHADASPEEPQAAPPAPPKKTP